MSTYRRFAGVYDKMGSDRFSKRMFDYTQQILSRLPYCPHAVLDLACGTGTAATLWAESGVAVFGIDGSAHMLTIARKKAKKRRVRVLFSRQPLTSFSVKRPVDLVSCYFDSLNYLLTVKDLTNCFKCVKRALRPNGYFIFDMNTPEAMKVLWGSQIYGDATADLAWIWKNLFYPKLSQAELKATFFVRRGRVWERFDEVHTERGYRPAEIKKALAAAGLKTVYVYECLEFSRPRRDSCRVAVVAQKRA